MKADLFIRNGRVFNSFLQRFDQADVAIKDGRILYVGRMPESLTCELETDAEGLYLVPGLIDIHMHIESSMITPEAFSWGTIRHGVTTVVAEPHEIANVAGMAGIEAMIAAAEGLETDIFYGVSSSVPCGPHETTGGTIGTEETRELLKNPKVVCIGEVMNFTEVTTKPDSPVNRLLRTAREIRPNLPIEAHCPGLMGFDLAQMMWAGLDGDHTEQTPERLMERMRLGMTTELQHKSLSPEVLALVREHRLEHHVCLVTDDSMPDTFLYKGHLDYVLRTAVERGLPPEQAVFMATWTPAARMQFADRGMLTPGRLADIVFLSDLPAFEIRSVMKNGRTVFEADRPYPEPEMKKNSAFPSFLWKSVRLPRLTTEDFLPRLETAAPDGTARFRLMVLKDGTTMLEESVVELPLKDGIIQYEGSSVALAAVLERYGKKGSRGYGFIGGDVLKEGAVATTLAHDHHNLLAVGVNPRDLAVAANRVVELQGGYVVAKNGVVVAEAPLPIGGILSDRPLSETAERLREVREAMTRQGYRHYSPLMSLSTVGLSVSPYLRITDLGLVQVRSGCIVGMTAEE